MDRTSGWLRDYDLAVPRYTSYPTAPHFTTGYGAREFERQLGEVPTATTLSLYVHMPFCRSLCWYCGCNMMVSRSVEDMTAYSETVVREIALVADRLNGRRPVSNIHFGGGTPTWGPREGRAAIMHAIRSAFDVKIEAEVAFEADPRTLSDDVALELADLGVNRVSLGVQDFDPDVQEAINRVQPFAMVERAVAALHKVGITNINLDLMYGLPLQTEETIANSIALALSLEPRRVALFGYAHVPWMKKRQRLLERAPLPNAAQRFALLRTAQEKLLRHGFTQIGIDHFAAPHDALTRAAAEGTLARNFQGYTADVSSTLLGFGTSAISALPVGYAQNDPSLGGYAAAIADARLATVRGYVLTPDDVRRRDLIMTLMCQFRAEIPPDLAQSAKASLAPLVRDGLCYWENERMLVIAPDGHPWVRVVAACFDTYHAASMMRHARAV